MARTFEPVARFVNWKLISKRPSGAPKCSVKSSSMLGHAVDTAAIASARMGGLRASQSGRAHLCANCERYVRAAHWLHDRGLDVSEAAVQAVALLLGGPVKATELPIRGYQRQLVIFQIKKLAAANFAHSRKLDGGAVEYVRSPGSGQTTDTG